jgi:Copper type II ascorbate-dependent monooxygenase, N-terminal domain/Copper type II ascorbate-dependent monooxygenase, C-terminal domain
MTAARVFISLAAITVVPCFGQPTYSKEVSRIFQAKCQQCHRDNDIAPFALKDYDTAVAWSEDIARVVTDRIMPPWKPVAGHGDFRDSFALTDDDRQTILDWVAAGTPQGDPADMPDPLPDRGQWVLGDPDLVLPMTQEFNVPRGKDVYRCFVLPGTFDTTQYASAFDVVPGDRKLVHHVLLFADTKGEAAKLDGQDGQPGYDCFGSPGISLSINSVLAGWAPGQRPHFLPDGIGVELPKNSQIVMQVHYYPIGRSGVDLTRVGVYFSKVDIQQRLFNIPVLNTSFKIEANADSQQVNATFPVLPFLDGKVISVYPHMHLLGTKINVEVTDSTQNTRPMIYIDNWDFNWQGPYTYVDPLVVKSGSTIKLTCTYNNSDSNPKNPNNPIVPVGWGERTTDEMCLAFLGVTLDYEKLLPLHKAPSKN